VAGAAISLLLLEPDRPTRHLYTRELGRYYRVVPVERLPEALQVLSTQEVHVAILEPGTFGDELWRRLGTLRAQRPGGLPPVIICSAIDERSQAYRAGVSAYLIKPVSPQRLAMEVARWLAEAGFYRGNLDADRTQGE
jgi:CheY-like chemotaxis protein